MIYKELFENSLQIEARFLAEKYHLNIVFRGIEAKTDGKTIWLPALPVVIDTLTQQVYRGYLAHEVGHCRYTDWEYHRREQSKYQILITKWKKLKNKPKIIPDEILQAYFMGVLTNIFEDPFVDNLMMSEFPGCIENIIQQNRYFDQIIPNFIRKELTTWDKILLILYLQLYQWDDQKYPELSPKKYGEDLVQFVKELLKEEICDAKNVKSTSDNYALAYRAFEKLKDFIEHLESDEKSEEQTNLETLLDSETKQNLINFNEQSIENIFLLLDKGKILNEVTENLCLNFKNRNIYPPRPYTTEEDKVEMINLQDRTQYNLILQKVQTSANYLRQKFLLLLRAKTNSKWQRSLLQGKLDNLKLSKIIKANYINSPLSIYKQKAAGLKLKTAVSILIDASGSMNQEEAQTVLISLAEPLAQLNIPTEIISFTTKGQTLDTAIKETGKLKKELCQEFTRFDNLYFQVFKQFHENFQKTKYRLGTYQTVGLTPIFEAIEFAGKRLYNYKRNLKYRKILFVITDGIPNLITAEEHLSLMLGMIIDRTLRLEKVGIRVCGIGLRSPFVQEVFRDAVVTEELNYDHLAQLLVEKLTSCFIV